MIEILEYILSYIERISKAISWQLIVVILLFFGRKQIGGVVSSFATLLGKANRFIFDGKTLTIEEVIQKCQEQKDELNDQKREIEQLENGGIRNMPQQSSVHAMRTGLELLRKSNIDLGGIDIDKIDLNEIEVTIKDEDPLKGKFGGKNAIGNILLDAKVSSLPNELYKIEISLRSSDNNMPLKGNAKFFLHPTFSPDIRTVKIENGVAKLTLISYGSFTLGAEYEGKRLELDLAELEGVGVEFKER